VKALVLAFALAFASVAVAAPPSTPGQRLFQAGERAFHRRQWEEARRAFAAAYELDRKPELLYDVAIASWRLAYADGKLASLRSARDAYRRYLDEAPNGRSRTQAAEALQKIDQELQAVPTDPISVTPAPEPITVAPPAAHPPDSRAPIDPYDLSTKSTPPAQQTASAKPLPKPAPSTTSERQAQTQPTAPLHGRIDIAEPAPRPAPTKRRWVTPVAVTVTLVGAAALTIGLAVGLTQSSSSNPSLGTVNWPTP